jgi:hypothetical protein
MTNEEYKSRCSELQDRIILSSLSNFGPLLDPQPRDCFKEAREKKRKSGELIYNRRKSRNIDELIFEPKAGSVQVDFGVDKADSFRNNRLIIENS